MMVRPALRRTVSLGAIGLLLIGALAYVMRNTGPLAPVQVQLATVEEASLTPTLFGIGTVEARRGYLIGPTGAGRVLRVLVDVGDKVKAGQVLAEMDPVDLDDRLRSTAAAIERAGSTIVAARAQTVDAQARGELAAANTRRNADLASQGFISAGAMEGKTQELRSADAGVRSAQANLVAAGHELERIKAERTGLQQQRDNIRLRASQDGIVLARDAEPGSTVVAGQAVLRLIDPASLWVKARFDQGRSAGLAAGLPAEVVLRSNPATTLRGSVARVDLQGDSVTEERLAQIALDQLPSGTGVGELAEVTLTLPATTPSLVVPNAAIRRVSGQVGVWLLQGSKLRFAALQLGSTGQDGRVQALEGLTRGDQVVVYSARSLTADTRIQVVRTLTAAAP
ncbi:MAG TPA: efflux RND transporter periplasmic adaptor subunit [Burkholderiaceae bacterium]|nr:efflux RND transporter periplasmic adaptor subunit [Burkholderiaceae bacterium]